MRARSRVLMRPVSLYRLVLVLSLVLVGCDGGGPDPGAPVPEGLISRLEVRLNPSGRAPLSAEIDLATTQPVAVEVTVEGKGGAGTEIRHRFPGVSADQRVPVLGLYPGQTTAVTLELFGADGASLGTRDLDVSAAPLDAAFPYVSVDVPASGARRPGLNLVSYFGHAGSVTPQRAFMFDDAGTIRWALDLTGDGTLGGLFFDDGVERLANGNLYFGDRTSGRIYEVDMLGRTVRSWGMPGFSFHHQVLELPAGNFLVTVNRDGAATVEDHVIEIDRQSGAIVTVWDLRQSLDPGRRAWPTDLADLDVDWFHGNGIAYDPTDDTILVSGRTQGVVKLTRDNRVVWILAPHREWRPDLASALLQPLDAAGRPITDPAVLDGTATHPDFEWAWYQHAPTVLPDGTVSLFDNGDNRGYGLGGTYSRAVLYDIDAQARTVRQVWAYGRERGAETYSRIVSDVDVHPEVGTVLFMPGAVADGGPVGKLVEVDRASRSVRFEATVRPPQAAFGITFHRIERLPLYPNASAPRSRKAAGRTSEERGRARRRGPSRSGARRSSSTPRPCRARPPRTGPGRPPGPACGGTSAGRPSSPRRRSSSCRGPSARSSSCRSGPGGSPWGGGRVRLESPAGLCRRCVAPRSPRA